MPNAIWRPAVLRLLAAFFPLVALIMAIWLFVPSLEQLSTAEAAFVAKLPPVLMTTPEPARTTPR